MDDSYLYNLIFILEFYSNVIREVPNSAPVGLFQRRFRRTRTLELVKRNKSSQSIKIQICVYYYFDYYMLNDIILSLQQPKT